MKVYDMILYSVQSLRHSQLRSWLTVLGIVIGVVSVVALIALSDGLNKSINEQLSMLGGRTIIIHPGSEESSISAPGLHAGRLTENDMERVKKVPGIDKISKMNGGLVSSEYKGKTVSSIIYGVELEFFNIVNVDLAKGRLFQPSEKQVAVVGDLFAKNAFGKNNNVDVGSVLKIGGKNYRVIGVLKKSANSVFNFDSMIFIPFDDSRDLLKSLVAPNEVAAIFLTVQDGFDMNDIASEIEQEVASSHRVRLDDKDFSVLTPQKISDQVKVITDLLALFLGTIGSISIVVGGIGIANTMFMNVLERKKEVGILKAIGATRGEILQIFLMESAIIGIIGGVAGIVIAVALLDIAEGFGAPVVIRPELIVFALSFSIIVGLISGVMPAKQAATVPAVEALREEL